MQNNKYYTMLLFKIIKVVGFADSFLRDAGVHIHRPIGITLTEASGMDILLRKMPVFHHEILSANMDASAFIAKLRQIHDDVAMIHYCKSEKAKANLDSLFEATLTGMIDGSSLFALPILVFDGFIPDEIVEELSLVLEFDSSHIQFSEISDVGVENDYFEGLAQNICRNADAFKKVIRDSWKNIDDLAEGEKLLLSGKAVIDFDMDLRDVSEVQKSSIRKSLDQAIKMALVLSESYFAKDQIIEKFKNRLRQLVITRSCNLSSINQSYGGVHTILFDLNLYYLTPDIFDEICNSISFTSSTRIKRCLSEKGILKTEGQGRFYYTRKIYGKGFDGQRFYCLYRSEIDHETDLDLTEI